MKSILRLFVIMVVLAKCISAQTISEVILPQYMEGVQPANADRIPCAYRLTITGLTPNANYRYINQFVISSDAQTANGAGNVIIVKTDGSDFVRTSSPSLSSNNAYGSFTASSTGTFTGWFVTEPTGNSSRMNPGQYVYIRLVLNDGNGGTTASARLTTADSIKVLKVGTTATDTAGTVLTGFSSSSAKNFVVLYDNVNGTGRPVSASFIESDGSANTTSNSYTPAYASSVDGVKGAFGTIIPNLLANGIRRIEIRSLTTGELLSVSTVTDGVWPGNVSTVNPTGGRTALSFTLPATSGMKDQGNTVPEEFSLSQNYPNPFNPVTTIQYTLPKAGMVNLRVFDLLGREVATLVNEEKQAGVYNIRFDAAALPSGIYIYRIETNENLISRKLTLLK